MATIVQLHPHEPRGLIKRSQICVKPKGRLTCFVVREAAGTSAHDQADAVWLGPPPGLHSTPSTQHLQMHLSS